MFVVVGLFAISMGLILTEFFIPGGVLGFVGALVFMASIGTGIYYFPDFAIFIVIIEMLGLAVCITAGLYLMRHSRIRGLMMLDDRQDPTGGWVSPAEDPALLGQLCEVYSALRPAGAILFNGRKVDAVSTGEFINAGTTVRVVEIEGHRVVVEAETAEGGVA